MSKSDAEVIQMQLWIIMCALSTNSITKAIAVICVGIHAIAAIFAAVNE